MGEVIKRCSLSPSCSVYGCPLAKKRKTQERLPQGPPTKKKPFLARMDNSSMDECYESDGTEEMEEEEDEDEEEEEEEEEYSEDNEEHGEPEEGEEERGEGDEVEQEEGMEEEEAEEGDEEEEGDDEEEYEEDYEEQSQYQGKGRCHCASTKRLYLGVLSYFSMYIPAF